VDCSGLLQLLLNVLINSPDAQLRKRGYYSVLAIITAAEPAQARCEMLLQLIARCPFTGAKGLLIDALRGEVKRAVTSTSSSVSSTGAQQQQQVCLLMTSCECCAATSYVVQAETMSGMQSMRPDSIRNILHGI
jgi:Uncharacterised protein family, YAP/Alf4/glomulin